MKIHPDSYKYLETGQVIALDQNFSDREGTLVIVKLGKGEKVYTYTPASQIEIPLTRVEAQKLDRIIYGWGPKVHSAPKNDEVPDKKTEVELGSFSKIKNSQDKSLMHLVPLNVIRAVADVYTAEFPQYGEDWKRLPNAKTVFYNALFRHMEQYQSGARYDDDGKLHSVKIVCNAIFLAWHDLIGGGKGDIEI